MRSAHRHFRVLCLNPRRHASTSTQTSVLTVLHKASSVLPQVLAPELAKSYEALFDESRAALQKKPNVARVSFHASDEWSKEDVRAIVSALLHEPFASDQQLNERIRSRAEVGTLSSGFSYLDQFPVPLEISEHAEQPTDLPASDISFYLFNPLASSSPVPTVPHGATLLLTAPVLSPALEAHLRSQYEHHAGSVLFLDPQRALRALSYLSPSTALSSSVLQSYQTEFVGSRVASVTSHIQSVLTPPTDKSSIPPQEHLHRRTAITRLKASLQACSDALSTAKAQIDRLLDQVAELRFSVERVRATETGKVLPEGAVTADVDLSKREMQQILNSLTLWRLAGLGRVDEVSEVVGGVVKKGWCRGLEDQLILHSGRMSAVQDTLTTTALSIISGAPPLLQSSVMLNKLQQIQHRTNPASIQPPQPTVAAGSSMLTLPIYNRRSQLITYSIPQLHVAAQRAVLSVYGGITSGALSAGWWTWSSAIPVSATDFTTFSLLSFNHLPPSTLPTSFAIGLVLSLSGFRLGQGIWKRAQRRFWADWQRISEGLERDLRGTLDGVLSKRVGGVAQGACEGLEGLAREREEGVRGLERAVKEVHRELEKC
ncbi:hypothetical protein BDV98DRAFT_591942 [Pterulicium gracile]|uniref:Uncharacterized protein n=1 Tax=Pterulicium gracile TaxID=1884261 RepID=A0A5C3QQR9_9AGAR|nr:hypothetical protein BDV98DRAFT_591942 [Pterula gracilis]